MLRPLAAAFMLLAGNVAVPAGATSDAAILGPKVLRSGSGRPIAVWRDREALKEGFKLIEEGIHRTQPQLVGRLIACVVPSETRVTVTTRGMLTNVVLVVEGAQAGCRGAVDADQVQPARRPN